MNDVENTITTEPVEEPKAEHHNEDLVMLTDVEGNRFDIPDMNALDPESRSLLEQRM